MTGTGDHSTDRGHACANQPPVVVEALIAHRVELVDRNHMRRKTSQVVLGRGAGKTRGVVHVRTVGVVDRAESSAC